MQNPRIPQRLTGTALPNTLPTQQPLLPAQTSELLLPSQTPRLLGSTEVSVPATSATSLGGEGRRSLISPWPELPDFLISCQLCLHTSLLPPALVHSLLTQSPSPPAWLTESKGGSLNHTALPFLSLLALGFQELAIALSPQINAVSLYDLGLQPLCLVFLIYKARIKIPCLAYLPT